MTNERRQTSYLTLSPGLGVMSEKVATFPFFCGWAGPSLCDIFCKARGNLCNEDDFRVSLSICFPFKLTSDDDVWPSLQLHCTVWLAMVFGTFHCTLKKQHGFIIGRPRISFLLIYSKPKALYSVIYHYLIAIAMNNRSKGSNKN